MSFNLLETLKSEVTGSLAKQASSFLGTSENNVSSALDGIFPSLLGSMIDKASNPSGADGLMNMVKMVDSDLLGNIGSLFGGGEEKVNGILNSGGGMIESLLGNKVGGVIDLISKVSGLGKGNTGSLLKMAAPFLIGMISKKLSGGGVSGLVKMLMGQKDHVQKALPSGMGSMLGLSSFGDFGKTISDSTSKVMDKATETARAAGSTTTQAASSGMGFLKWLLPLLLLALLAYFLLTKGCSGTVDDVKDATNSAMDKTSEMASDVADKAGDVIDAAGDMAKAAFTKVDESARAALGEISFAANSAGEQMMNFIAGKGDKATFVFNNLTFETGSAKIDAASAIEVDNIAAILKAYPEVKVEIGGHTDNTGDAASNETLSKARAESVKARLSVKGIDAGRISTKGYGQNNPIASNDTADGRAQNRRIEIKVVN